MIEKLQPFVNRQLSHIEEVERDLFMIYDNEETIVGEYELFDGQLQRIQFFEDEENLDTTPVQISAQQATAIATTLIKTVDDRRLVLDSLVNFDTHYLAIFEETDERYTLPLPNTGAHVSIDAYGYLISAMFFTEAYTVAYPEHIISVQQAREVLQTLPLVEKAIDTQAWRYVYTQNHRLFGIHIDGTIDHFDNQPDVQVRYYPVDVIPTTKSLEAIMLGAMAQDNISIKEDTSIEHVRHWYAAQPDEDSDYQLDLSSFDDVDEEVLDFDLEMNDIVEFEDTGIYLPDDQLLRIAQELMYVLVGEQLAHYKREETTGLEQLLSATPFELDMFEPTDATYRFVYQVDDVYLQDKAIDISIHRSAGVVVEVVQHVIDYDVVKNLRQPRLTLQQANDIAQGLADVELAFMRTSIEENLYELTYMINYPNSPTGGHIDEIDADTGEVSYVDTGFSGFE